MGCDNWPQQEEKPHVGFNDWPAKTRDEQEIDSLKKVVATKDKEIEALKADNEALAELIRLKEAFDPSKYHKDLIRGYKAQRVELRAEIKQLREVVERTRQYCESGNGCGGATKLPSGEWHNEGEGTLYHAVLGVLSPEQIEQAEKEESAPTDDEIHFVAVDESNADRHGWLSLNQKPAYVDGFEDGAKWMRNKRTT